MEPSTTQITYVIQYLENIIQYSLETLLPFTISAWKDHIVSTSFPTILNHFNTLINRNPNIEYRLVRRTDVVLCM